jgi:hypothetical protein
MMESQYIPSGSASSCLISTRVVPVASVYDCAASD